MAINNTNKEYDNFLNEINSFEPYKDNEDKKSFEKMKQMHKSYLEDKPNLEKLEQEIKNNMIENKEGLNGNGLPNSNKEIISKNGKYDNNANDKSSFDEFILQMDKDLDNYQEFIDEKHIKAFDFGIKWLDDLFHLVYSITPAGYSQIQAMSLFMISFIFAKANADITPFYLLDMSKTGGGKTKNYKIQKHLLKAIINECQEMQKEAYNSLLMAENDEETDQIKPIYNSFNPIQEKTSAESLYQTLENPYNRTLLIFFDEIGKRLNSKGADSGALLFTLQNHGTTSITNTNFKKDNANKKEALKKPLEMDNIKLYCYYNSNFEYLNKEAFLQGIRGGLFNRPLIVCNQITITKNNFEVLKKEQLEYLEDLGAKLYEFAKLLSKYKIDKRYRNNELFFKFRKWCNAKTNEKGDDLKDLYTRMPDNLYAITEVIHYANEFQRWINNENENFYFKSTIPTSILKTTLTYFYEHFTNQDELINEINNDKQVIKENKNKIINFLIRQKENGNLPISKREAYRGLNMKEKEFSMLGNGILIYSKDKKSITDFKTKIIND